MASGTLTPNLGDQSDPKAVLMASRTLTPNPSLECPQRCPNDQWDTDPKGDQSDPKDVPMANGTLTSNPHWSDPNGQWDTDPKFG
ncbi:hypothetical protein HGM15179_019749 [Zosterops borbonicus]|uniref:Uncharacterized protein n=1 Tax=Zosterops borbonicus TaxID=364589 RepID=A0A8K1D937_9PASS|nr:hypothetical protein HGM15179_019749 [Zosterops borbonicus]